MRVVFTNGRRHLLAGLLAGAVLMLGDSAQAWYPYGLRYSEWQRHHPFTFAAVHGAVPEDYLSERIARFEAAGLNTFVCWDPCEATDYYSNANSAALQWACGHESGIGGIDGALAGGGGVFVLAGNSPVNSGDLPAIASVIDHVHTHYPDLIAFANLSFTGVDPCEYVDTCNPDVVCFSQQPMLFDGSDQTNYLSNVNSGREFCRERALPYWMILQANGCGGIGVCNAFRIPGEADLRYLVYTFLAHGGKGIIFSDYYGDEEDMIIDAGIDYGTSPPAAEHKYENTYPSRTWSAVADVAAEVDVLGAVLVHLRSTDTIGYVGTIPYGCSAFAGHGALLSVEVVENASDPVMIAWFDDWRDQEYFMVVNLLHGLDDSQMDTQRTVRLTFDSTVEWIERLNRLTGEVEVLHTRADGGNRTLQLDLKGGTGDLLRYGSQRPWPATTPDASIGDLAELASYWLWCSDPCDVVACGAYLDAEAPRFEFNPGRAGLAIDFDDKWPRVYGICGAGGDWDFTTEHGIGTAADQYDGLSLNTSLISAKAVPMATDIDWVVRMRLRRNGTGYSDGPIELNGSGGRLFEVTYNTPAPGMLLQGSIWHVFSMTQDEWHVLTFHYKSASGSVDVWLDDTPVAGDIESINSQYDLTNVSLAGPTSYDELMVAPVDPYWLGDFNEDHYVNLRDFWLISSTWVP